MREAFVYIMTDHRRRVLYAGVTGALARRVYEHRHGVVEGFTSRYGLTRLVYCERHVGMLEAIQREKAIKRWPRSWKNALVSGFNPAWDDLYATLNA